MTRFATALVIAAIVSSGCGGGSDVPASGTPGERPQAVESTVPGTVTRGDSSTDLDRTPLSAADYQMYVAIMGGASALLSTLSDQDKQALTFAKKVEAGTEKVTPSTEPLLARARALREQDIELARLQGIEPRYRVVKQKVEAAIGPNARPPAADDAVAKENVRYLEAHRATIERLQNILRDPLSRPATPQGIGDR